MANQEELDQQYMLLTTHRRTLSHYLNQQAALGTAYVTPNIVHGINEARGHIQRIKQILREWGLVVDNHPDDEASLTVGATRSKNVAALSPDIIAVGQPESLRSDLPIEINTLPTFLAGPPISHPSHFFGRTREVKRFFNLLKRLPLQNGAIIGPRRSGKTSLLHYLRTVTSTPQGQLRPEQQSEWLPTPERYRWIFVDFQDPRLGHQNGLLRYLLACLDLPATTPCSLDHFMDVVSQNLRNPTVILLDEIGIAMERYPELDDTFWEGLRALATNQVGGQLAFVLAAHESPDQLARHSNLGSPFFNIFGYTAPIGPLTEQDARALIDSSPLPFSDSDIEWILTQSKCWPLLLQILCRERLLAIEEGEDGNVWQAEALRQITPFRYLLDVHP